MDKNILGRGLDSLIPPKKIDGITLAEVAGPIISVDDRDKIRQLPIDQIAANPHQPRQQFDHQQLEDLIESIREHGIIQPLVVTKNGDNYQLIAGERRLRAAKFLELATVPAIVRQAGEQEKLELSLIENIQRQDLNPLEEAIAYQRLADEFNLTREAIGKKVGKSKSAIVNQLRLLSLPEEIKQALIDGQISAGHGKVIAGITDVAEQLKFFKKVLKNQMNVRETESAVQEIEVKKHTRRLHRDPNLVSQEELLQGALGTKVKISKKNGQGKIMVEFYSEEELTNIIDKIVK
jgi:ParB family transcriptional regulator, chromosome partitioning protein